MSKKGYKLVIVGDSGVGKTSFIQNFVNGTFSDQLPSTVCADVMAKMHTYNGREYRLIFWDTAGQERFRTMTSSFFKGAPGVLLMYSVASRESFEKVSGWLAEAQRYDHSSAMQVILVGNKIDLPREVSTDEGLAWARSKGLLFIETSVKDGQNIEAAVNQILHNILQNESQENEDAEDAVELKDNGSYNKERSCC